MRTLVTIILVVYSSLTAAAQWKPLVPADEDSRLGRVSYAQPDHLIPVGNLAFIDCVARYDRDPYFLQNTHWCLQRTKSAGTYTLLAWSANPSSPDKYDVPDKKGIPLDADIAASIHEIWLNALLQARYPRFDNVGLDGESILFSATRYASNQVLGGSAWSPSADLPPAWLTILGHQIYQFGSDSLRNPDELRRLVSRTKKKLYDYYQKKGI